MHVYSLTVPTLISSDPKFLFPVLDKYCQSQILVQYNLGKEKFRLFFFKNVRRNMGFGQVLSKSDSCPV